MNKCEDCGAPMAELFTSSYCSAECDRPKKVGISVSSDGSASFVTQGISSHGGGGTITLTHGGTRYTATISPGNAVTTPYQCAICTPPHKCVLCSRGATPTSPGHWACKKCSTDCGCNTWNGMCYRCYAP